MFDLGRRSAANNKHGPAPQSFGSQINRKQSANSRFWQIHSIGSESSGRLGSDVWPTHSEISPERSFPTSFSTDPFPKHPRIFHAFSGLFSWVLAKIAGMQAGGWTPTGIGLLGAMDKPLALVPAFEWLAEWR